MVVVVRLEEKKLFAQVVISIDELQSLTIFGIKILREEDILNLKIGGNKLFHLVDHYQYRLNIF